MARRTRHATDTGAGSTYPALVNQGYVSDYFLAYRLDAGLAELYTSWEERERQGHPTPRTRLRSLSTAVAKYRVDAAMTAPEDDETPVRIASLPTDAVAALRDLNDATLDAFGWTPERSTVTLVSGDTTIEVPVAHQCRTASGLLMLAIETVFTTDPSSVVSSKQAAAGTLLDPLTVNARPAATSALEAAQAIFTADDPPTFLLVCSGGSVTLLDRNRWGEGVYLAADLDDAVARGDHRAKGELAAIAALFSADAIDPGSDAQSALAALLDKAANESAGVSKELRHGVRRSVELLANAVVADVRYRQKGAWQQIDPEELTRQSLRYLYRIIVLLFAEARPELGILPVDDPDYQSGYSLARLRDTALVDLHAETAQHAVHIQQSLEVLFDLVNDGYEPEATLDDVRSITFPGLRSTLFGTSACPMLDRARLTDTTLQQVLSNLCFTQPKAGRSRQSLSYATLGINQLGAVYEGLMAYRGFLATEELYEIDNDGDPDTGTWVLPVRLADDYPDYVFLTEEGADGQPRKVLYREGDFVFRLAGRDRQRSASYYTPEVLTEFTVRHALDVYEEERPEMTADDWLSVTVCEPALGSGAFGNEAVNQLAARYLKAAQDEHGETIDPDQYQMELQKAKAHFAINRTYGVDLNRAAVELAEVSFWLNCMHDGLQAPRFDARLRRGNSLIGARRSTYTAAQVAKAPWKGTGAKPVVPPTDQPLDEVPLGMATGIHHFLVPGEGWGSAAGAVELKGKKGQPGLAEEWAQTVKNWRSAILAAPSRPQIDRLTALSSRIEQAWAEANRIVTSHLRAHERHIAVWGADPEQLPPKDPKGALGALDDPNGPVARLQLVMDAWCALWMWAPANGTGLPTFDEWLDAVELTVGQPAAADTGALFSSYELQDGTLESVEHFGKATVNEVIDRHSWLTECRGIVDAQAFFHWELELAPVFEQGGFDVQVGNPPWVRPTWDEPASLAEHDPWWSITDLTKTPDGIKRARRQQSLDAVATCVTLAADRAENEGLIALLSSMTREPLLAGVQTNLYMVFMTNTWRRAGAEGVVGLVHPESHFVDPKAGQLRSAAYRRLRRHWQFANELFLFADVHHVTEFGVHLYASPNRISFVQAVNLLSPATIDRSLDHDGSGELPGIQFPEGGWDLRPHAKRLVDVDETVLSEWVQLFDEAGTPAERSRLLRPLTTADLKALSAFARQPNRLGQTTRHWTSGFHEKGAKDDGTFEWRTETPASPGECILQGPHILNATPFAQQPRPECKNNTDWEALDLETLPEDFVPRTNYQRRVDWAEFVRRQTVWDGRPYTARYRLLHRQMVGSGSVRTMQAVLAPPGPAHIHSVVSHGFSEVEDCVVAAGQLAALPLDYLIKAGGLSNLVRSVTDSLPMARAAGPHRGQLILRTLRLNCVTSSYAALWEELFDGRWGADEFVAGDGTVDLGDVAPIWSAATPLRTDLDRWLALCEIDALVARLLGLTEEQLLQMYRSQFAVLRKYEYATMFDANGRQIAGSHHNHGFMQAQWEANLRAAPAKRGEKRVGMWDRVLAYVAGDTSVDLGPFVPPFVPADRETAMSNAYEAFAARMADS